MIKSKLKIGSITITSKDSMAIYRVRKKLHIIEFILPIFDAYPLLTSKNFKYQIFKKSILIANDSNLTRQKKDLHISNLKIQSKTIPFNYVSPVWWRYKNNEEMIKDNASKIIKKAWLVGFVEAEGSFYIVKKNYTRLVHVFEITQKLDYVVLRGIASIFDLKLIKKKTYFSIVTTKNESIKKISNYFFKTMKGMKSLEFRIWARSFNKKKKNFNYLLKIQNLMQKIRSIRFNKNGKKFTS